MKQLVHSCLRCLKEITEINEKDARLGNLPPVWCVFDSEKLICKLPKFKIVCGNFLNLGSFC